MCLWPVSRVAHPGLFCVSRNSEAKHNDADKSSECCSSDEMHRAPLRKRIFAAACWQRPCQRLVRGNRVVFELETVTRLRETAELPHRAPNAGCG